MSLKQIINLVLTLLVAWIIAAPGAAVAEPFYFSWGHTHRSGFSFVGKPDAMRTDCLNFMTLKRINYSSELSVRGTDLRLPADTSSPELCQLIFQKAESLGSSEKQRIVGGRLEGDQFFFVGKPSGLLTACKTYLATRRIVSTGRLEFSSGAPLPVTQLYGDEICGVITARADIIGHPYDLYVVSGTVQEHGFAFFGNPEKIIDSCQAFLTANRISILSQFDLTTGPVRFPTNINEQRICGEIFRRAQLVADARRVYSFQGQINQNDVWFVGKPDKLMAACIDYTIKNRLGRISSVIDQNGHAIPLLGNLVREGVCAALIPTAQRFTGNVNWFLSSGELNQIPFLWDGPVELVASQCNAFLLRNHIASSDEVTIDGQVHRLSRRFLGDALCYQIIENSVPLEGAHPVYDASGELNDEHFWFHGRVEEFIRQCLQFSLDHRFQTITKALVNGAPWPLSSPETPELVCRNLMGKALQSTEPSFTFQAGQIKGLGFTFVGRNTDILNACEARLTLMGVTSGDKFVLHDQEYLRDTNWTSARSLCDEFEKKGISFAEMPNVNVDATIAGLAFTASGRIDEVMQQCIAFVSTHDIGPVATMVANGQTLQAPFTSWFGEEVCGVAIRAALPVHN